MANIGISKLAQVAVAVRDVERAKAFYGEALGLPHLFDAPPGLSFFRCGETRLMLSQPEGPETAGSSILYFGVADVPAAHAALTDRGIAFEQPPHVIAQLGGRDVRLAICRDSEGNLIGLIDG